MFFLPWVFRIFFSESHIYQYFYDYIIETWNYWDAPHFLYIAKNWYTSQGDPSNFIVFLPFYPILVSGMLSIFRDPVISGVVVSLMSFLLAISILFKLNINFMTKVESYRSIWFLMIFPTSLFLSAPYSESLFILLWSISFLAAFQKKWAIAGIAVGLACITRNFGLLILPSLFVHWLTIKDKKLSDLFFLITPTIVTTGLYLLLNYRVYGDFFAFQKIMNEHWQKTFSFPITSFINTWKLSLNNPLDHYSLTVGWSEAIAMTISYGLIPLAYKKLPKSLFVYHLLATLLISSTSFILSTPRYLLSIPTVFMIIGKSVKNTVAIKVIEFTSIGLLFLLTYAYTKGQWAF